MSALRQSSSLRIRMSASQVRAEGHVPRAPRFEAAGGVADRLGVDPVAQIAAAEGDARAGAKTIADGRVHGREATDEPRVAVVAPPRADLPDRARQIDPPEALRR